MASEFLDRFAANLRDPRFSELLMDLGAKLLEGKPLWPSPVTEGLAEAARKRREGGEG